MTRLLPTQARVARDVLLDTRLALFHRRHRWLAIADLHFGFEISQRAAGRLLPFWGMQPARERLLACVRDYAPETLVIAGDIVHDQTALAEAVTLLAELRKHCAVVAIAGNHDRKIARHVECVEAWSCSGFEFHHGHCDRKSSARVQVIGHHHPAETLSDGAGLRIKLPAFVQEQRCWILPAFSPWAAGGKWQRGAQSRVWVCAPQRVFELPRNDPPLTDVSLPFPRRRQTP